MDLGNENLLNFPINSIYIYDRNCEILDKIFLTFMIYVCMNIILQYKYYNFCITVIFFFIK